MTEGKEKSIVISISYHIIVGRCRDLAQTKAEVSVFIIVQTVF